MNKFTNNVKQIWNNLSKGKKTILIIVVLIVVLSTVSSISKSINTAQQKERWVSTCNRLLKDVDMEYKEKCIDSYFNKDAEYTTDMFKKQCEKTEDTTEMWGGTKQFYGWGDGYEKQGCLTYNEHYEDVQQAEKKEKEYAEKQKAEQQESNQKSAADEKPESINKSNESTTTSSKTTSIIDVEPGEVRSLCNRTMKALGLNKIKTQTNAYPMGYPEDIYVVVGTDKIGQNIQCQANVVTWTVKSIRVNGALVYGE